MIAKEKIKRCLKRYDREIIDEDMKERDDREIDDRVMIKEEVIEKEVIKRYRERDVTEVIEEEKTER